MLSGQIDAPAKINLTLEILARRGDGYHGVRSVMLPIGLCDRLRWQAASGFAFHSGDGAPDDESNLALRALRSLEIEPPLRVELEKRIPVGAGLGGGSSDAAAILRAAAAGAFGELSRKDLDYVAIARRLGSDVPFFLVETGALVEGTGERVTALGALPPWWVVVVVPRVAISTAEAYARLDAERRDGTGSRPRNASASLRAVEAVQRGDFESAVAASMNDFEPLIAAWEPAVADSLRALRDAGARLARLSGSGAASFALAESEDEATRIARRLGVPPQTHTFVAPLLQARTWRA